MNETKLVANFTKWSKSFYHPTKALPNSINTLNRCWLCSPFSIANSHQTHYMTITPLFTQFLLSNMHHQHYHLHHCHFSQPTLTQLSFHLLPLHHILYPNTIRHPRQTDNDLFTWPLLNELNWSINPKTTLEFSIKDDSSYSRAQHA